LGRVEAAVAEFREVLRSDPVNADGWYGLSLNTVLDAIDTAHLRRIPPSPLVAIPSGEGL